MMAKKTAMLLPRVDELLRRFGDRLRMSRLRRRLSAKQVAERAGMAPMTLRSLERGGAGVTIGAYLSVMQVLGIETDLDLLAKADPLGRELQDSRLPSAARTLPRAGRPSPVAPAQGIKKPIESTGRQPGWVAKSGFASSETLVGLLDRGEPPSKLER